MGTFHKPSKVFTEHAEVDALETRVEALEDANTSGEASLVYTIGESVVGTFDGVPLYRYTIERNAAQLDQWGTDYSAYFTELVSDLGIEGTIDRLIKTETSYEDGGVGNGIAVASAVYPYTETAVTLHDTFSINWNGGGNWDAVEYLIVSWYYTKS